MTYLQRGLLCLSVLFLLQTTSSAQLNIYSGFSSSFVYNQPFDKEITAYNESRPWLSDDLNAFKNLIGLQVGLRYRYETIAFTAGAHIRSKKLAAAGESPVFGNFEDKFNFGINTYSLGTEIFIDPSPISFGGTIGYDIINIKHTRLGENTKESIHKSNNLSSHFFIAVNFSSSNTTKLSLQPFWDISWQGNNFSSLYTRLGEHPQHVDKRINAFGLSVILYNGN